MAGSNRPFVMIVVILAGMLVVGLLVTGGLMIFGTINRTQQAARPTGTPTLAVVRAPTSTPTIPAPTVTPLPTNTRVVRRTATPVSGAQAAGDMSVQGELSAAPSTGTPEMVAETITPTWTPEPAGETGTPAPTPEPVSVTSVPTRTPEPASQTSTPDTGIGGLEALLIAAGLVGVLFITRRLRTGS
jgi:hypothetical protein